MADDKNRDKKVYYTETGDRKHIFPECPYIKNRKTDDKNLKDPKSRKKKLCHWCKDHKTKSTL